MIWKIRNSHSHLCNKSIKTVLLRIHLFVSRCILCVMFLWFLENPLICYGCLLCIRTFEQHMRAHTRSLCCCNKNTHFTVLTKFAVHLVSKTFWRVFVRRHEMSTQCIFTNIAQIIIILFNVYQAIYVSYRD